MTIAATILRTHHTARQVRRTSQAQCRSMTRDHSKDRDRFWFGDNSCITVVRNSVYLY